MTSTGPCTQSGNFQITYSATIGLLYSTHISLGIGKNARAQSGSEGELEAISEAQRTGK